MLFHVLGEVPASAPTVHGGLVLGEAWGYLGKPKKEGMWCYVAPTATRSLLFEILNEKKCVFDEFSSYKFGSKLVFIFIDLCCAFVLRFRNGFNSI